MPSLGTKFSVGLFVIVGMAMVIIFILWLGMAQYFKEGRKYEAYFDESVQGLNKDSPVKYRGVGIGRVESISVAPDGKLICLVMNLDEPLKESDKMVAQLKSVGITGIMFVELERKKEGEILPQPKLTFTPKYSVIATRSSEIKQLLTDLNEIIEKLKQVDIKSISTLLVETLDNANQTIKDAEMKKISKNLQEVLSESRELMNSKKWIEIRENMHQASINLNGLIENTGNTISSIDKAIQQQDRHLSAILEEFQVSVEKSQIMIENGNALIQDSRFHLSNIDQELLRTLKNFEIMSKSLNQLVLHIEEQPSLLFFSEPPPSKPIE